MDPTRYPSSERTAVRRLPERGSLERALVHAILDEGLVCHVGFAAEHGPVVIPTSYARDGETLYMHGSPASRMLRVIQRGLPVCVTVTLVDGLVLARSAFHHSMNYRSAVLFGRARAVKTAEEKRRALRLLVEHVAPGRSADARAPNDFEERFTRVVAFEIEEASAKRRSGGPKDEEDDLALPHWAGEIPLSLEPGEPRPDPALAPGTAAPAYVLRYRRP